MDSANLVVEKRVHPRISVKIPIKYRLIEEHSEIESIKTWRKTELQARTLDMSLGGMAIAVDKPIKMGTLLRVDVFLPDLPNHLNLYAEAVWANESGAGLQFITMRDEDMKSLKNFLDKTAS